MTPATLRHRPAARGQAPILDRIRWLIAPGLAGLVALVVHQLAYLAAYPVAEVRAEALVGHGHLPTQWVILTPLAVVAATVSILRQVRQLELGSDANWMTVAGGGMAVFAIQELVETQLRGEPLVALAANPVLWIGLGLAPIVAVAMVLALRQTSELIARYLRIPAPLPRPVRDLFGPSLILPIESTGLGSVAARAPPGSLR